MSSSHLTVILTVVSSLVFVTEGFSVSGPIGAQIGISESGLKEIIGNVEPSLEKAIDNLKLKDYRTSHVHLTNMRTCKYTNLGTYYSVTDLD